MASKKANPLDVAHAKLMKKDRRSKKGGTKKHGRNRAKCANYRMRVGKPAGPGESAQHKH